VTDWSPVPAIPSSPLEPVWVEFAAVLPDRPEFDPTHPLGCHRRRIPDRVVFAHVVDALVHGSGYERIATVGCSDRTIRRRLALWAQMGIGQQVHALALAAYDRMIGLGLNDLSVDGAITKAPCGGDKAGPSPVDRRKGGLKRSTEVEADGIPLGIVSAPAAPTAMAPSSTSTSTSPPRSSPSVNSSDAPEPSTDGTPAPPPAASRETYCRSL
jgi:hypothetical protein